MKLFPALASALWAGLSAMAVEPSSPSSPAPAQGTLELATLLPALPEMPMKMWVLGRDLICNNTDPSIRPPVKVPGNQPPEDARGWLLANFGDLQFDPDELAIFDPRLSVLMVRAKRATLDRVDAFMQEGAALPNPTERSVRVDVSLVEFHGPQLPEFHDRTPYETLRQAAGDSWQVLNRLQATTESGRPLTVTSKSSAPKAASPGKTKDASVSENPSAEFHQGETGALLEVETIPSLDRTTIDVNLAYHYRAFGAASEWKTKCKVNVPAGTSVVLQIDSTARADRSGRAKTRALILRCDSLISPAMKPD